MRPGISQMSDFVQSKTPQSLQEMEPILETLNDGVVVADESDQILFVNTVFEEMTVFFRQGAQPESQGDGAGPGRVLPAHERRRATACGGQSARDASSRWRTFLDRNVDRHFGTKTHGRKAPRCNRGARKVSARH